MDVSKLKKPRTPIIIEADGPATTGSNFFIFSYIFFLYLSYIQLWILKKRTTFLKHYLLNEIVSIKKNLKTL